MMRPRDNGYSLALPLSADDPAAIGLKLHPQSRLEAFAPMWSLRLLAYKSFLLKHPPFLNGRTCICQVNI